jgi:hypothetical protein
LRHIAEQQGLGQGGGGCDSGVHGSLVSWSIDPDQLGTRITRSGGLAYRATAQWHADRSARRPTPAKLAINEPLRRYVHDRLAGLILAPNGAAVHKPVVPWTGRWRGRRQDRRWATAWNPEQIARRLRLDFPDDETMRISPEAIYQVLCQRRSDVPQKRRFKIPRVT